MELAVDFPVLDNALEAKVALYVLVVVLVIRAEAKRDLVDSVVGGAPEGKAVYDLAVALAAKAEAKRDPRAKVVVVPGVVQTWRLSM